MTTPNASYEGLNREQLRAQLELEYFDADMSQKVLDLVWRKAWEDGHASGNTEVAQVYDELADIAAEASNSGWENRHANG